MKPTHWFVLALAASWFQPRISRADEAAQIEFFERKIRPLLVEKCYSCHSGTAEEVEGKLWLDSKTGWVRGGQSGPSIVPGKPESSLLLHAIRGTEKDLKMPPDEKLSEAVIDDFESWIRQGAIDPRGPDSSEPAPGARPLSEREQWVYSKPVAPEIPLVQIESWCRNPIDRFILARLEAASLPPAEQATPEQLARRLFFDLTGLPPTPQEMETFTAATRHNRQQAVEMLVDDLLSRPSYGEKWGRHWLDSVRYADSLDARSAGGGDIVDSWRYRDWVVSALNADLPYDEFVRNQIAGDLLAQQQWNPDLVIATGVYAIGNWGNGDSDKKKVHTDIVDDQIDLTSRTFLGLTLSCARCHDHKFDPLTTADYYSMAGFFFSSRILEKFAHPTAGESLMRIDILPPEEQLRRNQLLARIEEIDQALKQKLAPLTRQIENVAGRAQLVSLLPTGADHPSLTLNISNEPQSYSTISLPASAVCVHPSPELPATIVWKAPLAGEVKITALIADVDGTGGDGVSWRLAHADQTLAQGDLPNGGPMVQVAASSAVGSGQLVRLSIHPKQNYFCDSTRIDLTIEHPATGQVWNLTQTLLAPDAFSSDADSCFVVCAGDGISLSGDSDEHSRLAALQAELKSQLPSEMKCQGLQEGGIPGTTYEGFHDAPIHVRGSYDRLASIQPRGFPGVFGTPPPDVTGSGRLKLANWIASADNPLTARVMVNRLWQHHFGRGIVATANNFGKLGTPPTHPELLDWLAVRLMEQGWSLKSLHRLICTSATYQQTSFASPEALKLDPDNLLWGRQTRQKLTAEELRDAILVSTGDLDGTVGGPAVADLNSSRRTLYLKTVRSDRTSYQLLFDGADPTSIVEQRNDSLIAPQALWLLNHPFVLKHAEALAQQVQALPEATQDDRLKFLFRQIFSREIRPDERDMLVHFFNQSGVSPQTWLTVCHVLLCSNNFVFID